MCRVKGKTIFRFALLTVPHTALEKQKRRPFTLNYCHSCIRTLNQRPSRSQPNVPPIQRPTLLSSYQEPTTQAKTATCPPRNIRFDHSASANKKCEAGQQSQCTRSFHSLQGATSVNGNEGRHTVWSHHGTSHNSEIQPQKPPKKEQRLCNQLGKLLGVNYKPITQKTTAQVTAPCRGGHNKCRRADQKGN